MVQNTSGNLPDGQDLARYARQADLQGLVWGDYEGQWLADWGGADGTSQHSYTILNSNRTIVWQRLDGGSTTLREIKQELDAAE